MIQSIIRRSLTPLLSLSLTYCSIWMGFKLHTNARTLARKYARTNARKYAHTYVHTCTHIRTNTRTHARAHTHTHTHTHSHTNWICLSVCLFKFTDETVYKDDAKLWFFFARTLFLCIYVNVYIDNFWMVNIYVYTSHFPFIEMLLGQLKNILNLVVT